VASNHSGDLASGVNVKDADTLTTAHIDALALESRIAGHWDQRIRWMLGFNLARDRGAEDHLFLMDDQSSFFPPPVSTSFFRDPGGSGIDPGAIVAGIPGAPGQYSGMLEQLEGGGNLFVSRVHVDATAKNEQGGVFLNGEWQVADPFAISAGVRYTDDVEHFLGCAYEPPDSVGLGLNTLFTVLSFITAAQYTAQTGMPGHPSIGRKNECLSLAADGSMGAVTGSLHEHGLSGRLGLDWTFKRGRMAYLSLSQGYKAGGFPAVPAANQNQYTPTRQERLLSAELGTKLDFFQQRLHANLDAFYYDYKDKQLLTKELDPTFGPLPILRNAPRSHVYGIETELQARPIRGLYAALAGSYVRTRIDEFVSADEQGNQQDFAGRPFNFSPPYQFSALVDYSHPLGSLVGGVGVDFTGAGTTYGDLSQTYPFTMAAHRLLGARVHIGRADQRWSVTAFGHNLTNALYSIGSYHLGDTVVRFAGAPRTYGIQLACYLD
jgi:outer membrane receptor protein involved in Fe transport